MASFFSEHTAEYVLAPTLANVLKKSFRFVLPIYFWASREGNSLGKQQLPGVKLKAIAVYPRRPKVSALGAIPIEFRFNSELFLAAKEFTSVGIPTIAGMPLTVDFHSLANQPKIAWLHIRSEEVEFYNEYLHFGGNKPSDLIEELSTDFESSPLMKPTEIANIVTHEATEYDWATLIYQIQHARFELRSKAGVAIWSYPLKQCREK